MANPTTNYGWPMPTATDLVTDLPADFAAFGQPVDTSLKALNPETTLGDIAYRSATANTNTRLPIGTTGQVLAVSGGVPAWATLATATFAGCAVYQSAVQSIPNNTGTAITFNSEYYDTDGFHSIVTNTSRITIPAGKAGYYLIQAIGQFNTTSTTGSRIVQVLKNGAAMLSYSMLGQGTATVNAVLTSNVYYLAVADYVELYVSQNTGGAVNFDATSNLGYFSVAFLGA